MRSLHALHFDGHGFDSTQPLTALLNSLFNDQGHEGKDEVLRAKAFEALNLPV